MQGIGGQPELKELVREASRALASLDAGRLEELALSCQALNRELDAELGIEPARLAKPREIWRSLAACWRRPAPICR